MSMVFRLVAHPLCYLPHYPRAAEGGGAKFGPQIQRLPRNVIKQLDH